MGLSTQTIEASETIGSFFQENKEPVERSWYKVSYGLGEFSVRAADGFFAIEKVEAEADRLEKIGVVIGLRLCLIDDLSPEELSQKERAWCETLSEVTLHSLIEDYSSLLPSKLGKPNNNQEANMGSELQASLFDDLES